MARVSLPLPRPTNTSGGLVTLTQDILARGYGIRDVHRTVNCDYSNSLDNANGYLGDANWNQFPEDNVRKIFTPGNTAEVSIGANEYIARWWPGKMIIDRLEIDHGVTVPSNIDIYSLIPGADPLDSASWTKVATIGGSANVVYSFPGTGLVTCGLKVVWLASATVTRWSAYIDHIQETLDSCPWVLGASSTGPTMRWDLGATHKIASVRWTQSDFINGTTVKTSLDGVSWTSHSLIEPSITVAGRSTFQTSAAPGSSAYIAGHNLNYTADATPSFVAVRLWDDSGNRASLPDGMIPRKLIFRAALDNSGGTDTLFSVRFLIVRRIMYNGLTKFVVVAVFREQYGMVLSGAYKEFTIDFDYSTSSPWWPNVVEPGDFIGIFCERKDSGSGGNGFYLSTVSGTVDPRYGVVYGRWNAWQGWGACEAKVVSGWNTNAAYYTLTSGWDQDHINDMRMEFLPYLEATVGADARHIEIGVNNIHTSRDLYWGGAEVTKDEDAGFGVYSDASATTLLPTDTFIRGIPGDPASSPITTIYIKNETGGDVTGVELSVSPDGAQGSSYIELSLDPSFTLVARNCTNNPGAFSPCTVNNVNWRQVAGDCSVGCGSRCTADNGNDDQGLGLDGLSSASGGWVRGSLAYVPSSPISAGQVIPVYIRCALPPGSTITAAPISISVDYWI